MRTLFSVWALVFILAASAGAASATPYTFSTYQAYQWPGGVFVGAGTTPENLKAYSVPASMNCELALTAAWNMSSNFGAANNFYGVYGGLLQSLNNAASSCAHPTPVKFNGTTGSLTSTVTSGTTSGPDSLAFGAHYSCPNTAGSYRLVFNGTQPDGTAPEDGYGNMPLRRQIGTDGYTSVDEMLGYEYWQALAVPDNDYCRDGGGTLPAAPSVPLHYQSASGYEEPWYVFAYPFNASSGSLSVNISGVWDAGFDVFQCALANRAFYLNVRLMKAGLSGYNENIYTEDGSVCSSVRGGHILGDDYPINFSRDNLTQDTLYYLVVSVAVSQGYTGGGGQDDIHIGEPTVTMDIGMNYAEWSCPAWSACFDGLQHRTCSDLNGYFQPREEVRNCSAELPGVLESAELGFETGASVTVTTCQPGIGWLGECVMDNRQDLLKNSTVEWPVGWVIIPNADTYTHTPYFAQLTSEWAAAGTRSLKMWRIPSANFEPGWSVGGGAMWCINTSALLNPSVMKDFNNDTMRASYDVTFPAEYMTVGFIARACSSLPERTSAMGNIINYCDRTCYGNCSAENPGSFRFAITENETGAILLEKYLSADDSATSYVFQLPAVDIAKTYRIQFAPYSDNPNDQAGNCFMVDAVFYNVTSSDLAGAEGECAPKCAGDSGLDFYSPVPGDIGTCAYVIERMSPKCLSAAAAAKAAVKQDFCLGSTLYSFNNFSGTWVGLPNATVCVEEQAQAAMTEGSLGLPEDNPMSPLNPLLSPLFVALVINIVVAALAAVGVGRYAEGSGSAVGAVFLGVMLIMALTFSYLGIYPAILGVVIIVIAGLLLAGVVRGMMAGGG